MTTSHTPERNTVFISYSHRDADWLKRLRVHLKPLERDYDIECWDDQKIEPGFKWQREIAKAVASAKVAILLISADFLASDFINNDELPPLLDAAEKEGARILPVIVSPSRFLRTQSLAQFQSVNAPNNPLINMSKGEQEAVFVQITEYIETIFETRKRSGSGETRGLEVRTKEPIGDAPLKGVSLAVYFDKMERGEAIGIYSFLQSKGMRPTGFGEGRIGDSGARTIVHAPELEGAAVWLKENIEVLADFDVKRLQAGDSYNGIVLNFW